MMPSAVASLFTGSVGVGIADPRQPAGLLYPEEEPAIARAVPKRRLEFTAGRVAARAALAELGCAPCALPANPDRVPHWPKGFAGCITHCDDLCLAVASSEACGIGVDLEPATDLPADLWPEILLPGELARVKAARQPAVSARMVFCAKEAAFKAQYPLTGAMFGFHDMEILDEGVDFSARFLVRAGNFRAGHSLSGRYFSDSRHIVATVEIRGYDK